MLSRSCHTRAAAVTCHPPKRAARGNPILPGDVAQPGNRGHSCDKSGMKTIAFKRKRLSLWTVCMTRILRKPGDSFSIAKVEANNLDGRGRANWGALIQQHQHVSSDSVWLAPTKRSPGSNLDGKRTGHLHDAAVIVVLACCWLLRCDFMDPGSQQEGHFPAATRHLHQPAWSPSAPERSA